MKPIYLLIATAACLASAQKPGKSQGASAKHVSATAPAYTSAYPEHSQASQYKAYPSAPSGAYHGHGGAVGPAYGGPYSGHAGGAPQQKPVYPQLISDQRQLNHDGTINFQYAADNGLQQGETVDPDGTRRGFYSYVGADGKPITVKYTAGKNGFVAEGAHLPKQPSSVPVAESTKEETYAKQGGGAGVYNAGNAADYDDGSYRPELYEHPYLNGGGSQEVAGGHHAAAPHHGGQHHGGHRHHAAPAHATSQYFGGAPAHYSAPAQSPAASIAAAGPTASPAPYRLGPGPQQHSSRPRYNPPSPYHDGASFQGGFPGSGPSSSSSQNQYPQGAPQTQYLQTVPSFGRGGPRGPSGPAPAASSPFGAPAGPGGPYNGQYDLGNGGQFSIDFQPGQANEGPASALQGAFSAPRPIRVRSRPMRPRFQF